MLQKASRYIATLFVFIASLAYWGDATAQVRERIFPETGHTVRGDILEFFESNPDAELVYGNPITDAFVDPQLGLIVQYFERARFELHPKDSLGRTVHLSPLGKYLYEPGPPLLVPKNFPACQKFVETGKEVCYAFLDFFNAHGGVTQFGYPISNFELQDERIVQYFQRARFEWHPEHARGERVELTDLGSRYFRVHSEAPGRLLNNGDIPQTILSLHASVFTEEAVKGLEGEQTIYVLVKDQSRQAVPSAQVTFTVQLPTGVQQTLKAEKLTDGTGMVAIRFTYKSDKPGIVLIWVEAVYDSYKTHTRTFFRVR